MIAWMFVSAALAQSTVVALGDGLVAGPPASGVHAADTVPGGWVAVLADCLEERAPRAWTVIDRAVDGETARSALERAPSVRELDPDVIVIGVGAREVGDPSVEPATFRADMETLVGELRRGKDRGVLIVGLVPPMLAQVPPGSPALASLIDQTAADRRTEQWNATLADVARKTVGVSHVDLLADWPRDERARGALTDAAWRLTDQGHARVAAAVCDAIVANWPKK